VKLNLYICCRCGVESREPADVIETPLGWATISYEQVTPMTANQTMQVTRLSTHACPDCAPEVLAVLKIMTKDVDRAFDDGGASP
jgi:hypothetical protein